MSPQRAAGIAIAVWALCVMVYLAALVSVALAVWKWVMA